MMVGETIREQGTAHLAAAGNPTAMASTLWAKCPNRTLLRLASQQRALSSDSGYLTFSSRHLFCTA